MAKDSDWVVQLEVVGENTGISILSLDKILKKILIEQEGKRNLKKI